MIWTGTSTHIIKGPVKQKKPAVNYRTFFEDIKKVEEFAISVDSQSSTISQ
jgi:hypothetical protein